jgi:hypothetical protein
MPNKAKIAFDGALMFGLPVLGGCAPALQESRSPRPLASAPKKPAPKPKAPVATAELEISNASAFSKDAPVYLSHYDLGLEQGEVRRLGRRLFPEALSFAIEFQVSLPGTV